MKEREAVIGHIEETAEALREAGACRAWLQQADAHVAAVSCEVNGPLMELLAKSINYHDAGCIQTLRRGAPLLGDLPVSGNGSPISEAAELTMAQLAADATAANTRVLTRMREDCYSRDLHTSCAQDAALGRMSTPVSADAQACAECLISPRFGVLQGKCIFLLVSCPVVPFVSVRQTCRWLRQSQAS